MAASKSDLMRPIDLDENEQQFSESSESEEEAQPTKKIQRKKVEEFNKDFEFIANFSPESSFDSWKHVQNYIKRKSKTPLDDMISKIRMKARIKQKLEQLNSTDNAESRNDPNEKEPDAEDESDMDELAEDELKHDRIRVKETELKRKLRRVKMGKDEDRVVVEEEEEDGSFFQDASMFDESATFFKMNLSRPLMKVIQSLNYLHPTPIQSATIPVALLGRDICGCAATGTGKTAAYMLPILERLLFKPKFDLLTRVLVLVPTRELGVQVFEVTKQLTQHTEIEIGLSIGGLDHKVQGNVLRKNPDIVIATPGRLIDHLMNTPSFNLKSIEILVLDEADRMLDEYFAEQLKEIIRQCNGTRQTMLFSATMTDDVNDLAAVSLSKPVKIFVDSNREVALNLRQEFVRIRSNKDREAILAALLCRTFRDHTMVFFQTKYLCYRLHIVLGLLGVKVGELQGNLTQPQRLDTLRKFRNEEIDVLLATDVAARGLDIHGVKTVINFTMPRTIQHYIHRVGRTARAGRAGRSVSLASEAERILVKQLVKKARNPVKSRVIPTEIIEKYQSSLLKIEPDVFRIMREAKERKRLLTLENEINKTMKNLKGTKNDRPTTRIWFQTDREKKDETKRLKNNYADESKEKTIQRERELPIFQTEDEERLLRMNLAYQARSAKRKRKPRKLYNSNAVQVNKGEGKKQPTSTLSSFENDMSTRGKRALKKLQQQKQGKSMESWKQIPSKGT